MPSTSISQLCKFKCVTWSLLSKCLARTCTLQRSGESERSKTCSTTPARWHRPWKRRAKCPFWTGSAPQCRYFSARLPRPGHPIIQKMVALRWKDLMTRFRSLDSKSTGYQFECSTWHHKSVELLVVFKLYLNSWVKPPPFAERSRVLRLSRQQQGQFPIKNCLCHQRVSAWDANVASGSKLVSSLARAPMPCQHH